MKKICHPVAWEMVSRTKSIDWGTLTGPKLTLASGDVKTVALVAMAGVRCAPTEVCLLLVRQAVTVLDSRLPQRDVWREWNVQERGLGGQSVDASRVRARER